MTDDDFLPSLGWLTAEQPQSFLLNPPTPPQTPSPNSKHNSFSGNFPEIYSGSYSGNIDYKLTPVKPKISYAQLIAAAMEAHGGEKVLLSDIYDWIREHYAYFRLSDASWQNSIRHNLSLNRQFIRVNRNVRDKRKGSYWMLDRTRKDPYCMRRRNFPPDSKLNKPKLEVSHPCVNPAIRSMLARLYSNSGANGSSSNSMTPSMITSSSSPINDHLTADYVPYNEHIVQDIGAQEYVTTMDYEIGCSSSDGVDLEGYRPQVGQGPRVRVEYNWEEYEYHPSSWGSAHLPLQGTFSPTGSSGPQTSFTSLDLSPPNSEDTDHGNPTLELRIPTPEWWRCSNFLTAHLSPTTNQANIPLGRVFESMNANSSSLASGRIDEHPWQDDVSSLEVDGVLQEINDYSRM